MDPAALEEWSQRPDWQSDQEVAYHEAGHAVVAHALGSNIADMTIAAPVEIAEGLQRGLTRRTDIQGPPLEVLRKDLQIAQAGWLATWIRFDSKVGRKDDLRVAEKAFEKDGNLLSDEVKRQWRLDALDDAAKILQERWAAVQALAAQLVEKRTLPGHEVHRIIETALP